MKSRILYKSILVLFVLCALTAIGQVAFAITVHSIQCDTQGQASITPLSTNDSQAFPGSSSGIQGLHISSLGQAVTTYGQTEGSLLAADPNLPVAGQLNQALNQIGGKCGDLKTEWTANHFVNVNTLNDAIAGVIASEQALSSALSQLDASLDSASPAKLAQDAAILAQLQAAIDSLAALHGDLYAIEFGMFGI